MFFSFQKRYFFKGSLFDQFTSRVAGILLTNTEQITNMTASKKRKREEMKQGPSGRKAPRACDREPKKSFLARKENSTSTSSGFQSATATLTPLSAPPFSSPSVPPQSAATQVSSVQYVSSPSLNSFKLLPLSTITNTSQAMTSSPLPRSVIVRILPGQKAPFSSPLSSASDL